MPVTYTCDQCGVTAPSLDGWHLVVVGYFYEAPNAPPPGGRTLNAINPDLLFHATACRDAWAAQAQVPAPPVAVAEPAPES